MIQQTLTANRLYFVAYFRTAVQYIPTCSCLCHHTNCHQINHRWAKNRYKIEWSHIIPLHQPRVWWAIQRYRSFLMSCYPLQKHVIAQALESASTSGMQRLGFMGGLYCEWAQFNVGVWKTFRSGPIRRLRMSSTFSTQNAYWTYI